MNTEETLPQGPDNMTPEFATSVMPLESMRALSQSRQAVEGLRVKAQHMKLVAEIAADLFIAKTAAYCTKMLSAAIELHINARLIDKIGNPELETRMQNLMVDCHEIGVMVKYARLDEKLIDIGTGKQIEGVDLALIFPLLSSTNTEIVKYSRSMDILMRKFEMLKTTVHEESQQKAFELFCNLLNHSLTFFYKMTMTSYDKGIHNHPLHFFNRLDNYSYLQRVFLSIRPIRQKDIEHELLTTRMEYPAQPAYNQHVVDINTLAGLVTKMFNAEVEEDSELKEKLRKSFAKLMSSKRINKVFDAYQAFKDSLSR